ncbi:hypothetical protein EMCRGX_G034285 [Ephydatia muelleri]
MNSSSLSSKSARRHKCQQANKSWQPTLNRFFGGKSVPVQTTLTHFMKKLGGEENVLPIESIKDESVTSKNKTAKNRPALEEKGTTYKPRKSLSLKKKKQFTFSSSVASSSYIDTLTSSAQEAVPPSQDDSEEDRQLLKGYSCTLDVRPPPLSLDDLEVWEESEKKRSKQLSVMSPLRGLKDASAAAVPDTPSSLPMAPSFSPRCTPLPFRKLLCQDICDTVGSNVSIPLFSPSPRPVEVSKRDGQAFRSGDQADMSGDQMGGPKSRKVLVFPEAAASDHKGEDLNKPASHEKQNESVSSDFALAMDIIDSHDQSALLDEILSSSLDGFGASCNLEASHVQEHGLNRYLVLESVMQEYPDLELRNKPEIMLRLIKKEGNEERFCYLRDCWVRMVILPGDIVQVNSELDPQTGCYIVDNHSSSSVIVNPDLLVSGTTIATSTGCLRKAVLSELFKGAGSGPTEAMTLGTLLHKVFQQTLVVARSGVKVTADVVSHQVDQVVHQLESLDQFYSLDVSETTFAEKLLECVPSIVDWCDRFLHDSPLARRGEIPFNGDEKLCVCVSEVVDIEESIWSPRYGLKGKVDVTVTLKDHRNGTRSATKRVPLELKTGKMYNSRGSVEHRAQVMLYSLMLGDRHGCPVPSGLLFYIKACQSQEGVKTGHMQGIPVLPHEMRGLLLQRNNVARYLDNQERQVSLPGMLKDRHVCHSCPYLQLCTLYHSSVERGTSETSGLGDVFDKSVSHLSPSHLRFFEHWLGLAQGEQRHAAEKGSKQPWASITQESKECVLTNLIAERAEGGKDRWWYQSFSRKHRDGAIGEVSISPNERIVVSLQDGRGWAIAMGYMKTITANQVEVTIDRPVEPGTVCRLDVEGRHSIGGLLTNLGRLFAADSEREHLLRRLIIDLVPPRFASEKIFHDDGFNSLFPHCASEGDVSLGNLRKLWTSLNFDQKTAILKAVSAKDYALILGMPGTGKTTTISCLVQVLAAQGRSVLITGYTHLAVDNILIKLKQMGVDFLRLGSVSHVHPQLHPHTVTELTHGITTVEKLEEFYQSNAVVATTCLGTNHTVFSKRLFDYCIVDEASQITLLASLGPLFHSKVFILVGDHYQLPPLVQSVQARDGGLGVSLFKRLSEHHPEALVYLVHQYRMNRDIMLLANTLVYNHRLMCGSLDVADAQLALPYWEQFAIEGTWLYASICPSWPVVFLNTDQCGSEEECTGDHMLCNMYEARTVETIATSLVKAGLGADRLGVITPYRYQQNIIRKLLTANSALRDIEVNTVDKYQGRDKSCVIVSFVRSNGRGNVGALIPDWRRINVALTRAEHKLIMIGSLNTLRHAPLMGCLLQLLEDNRWITNMSASSGSR